jgi:RNA polymerase sigma-70 factor (TIGR02957 family)
MDDKTQTFNRLRPRLQGIAYRMLGSLAEAEEVVQDAWLRWHEADVMAPDHSEAWLVTVSTRLAIDRLRSAKVQREHYAGFWLPEPQLMAPPSSPEQMLERADDVSVAFLRVLERLAPEARAAFLLREVFDADYSDLAEMLGKSEAACRQLVSRAKTQLQEDRPRYVVTHETHHRLLSDFAQAMTRGDFADLRSLLAEDAQLIGDGGGRVPSFPYPLLGAQRIAQLFYAAVLKHGTKVRIEVVGINGHWGLLRFIDGVLESAQAYETDGQRITRILVQRNPTKLSRLAAILGSPVSD